MDNSYIKKIFTVSIIAGLLILAFFILKPILMDILLGFIIAFIFYPIYRFFLKYTKVPTLSASIVTLILILLVIVPLWFFTPIIIEQALKFYLSAQNVNFADVLSSVFPSPFSSEQFASEIGSTLNSFVPRLTSYLLDFLSDFILNLPTFILHVLVFLITFFFALRDKESLGAVLRGISPFTRDVDDKIARYSKDITFSVLYGQVILGIIQGLILTIGLIVLKIPNSHLLGAISIVVGVLPIVGPMFVWIPLAVYLIISQNVDAAIILVIFGLISSNSENILRPLLISDRAKIHSGVVLVGMIGGLFLFGVLGILLGPLILAYLIIFLEILQGKIGTKDSFIKKEE